MAVAGKYDFVGVVLHEITEIMGRITSLGAVSAGTVPINLPFDLYR